LAVDTKYRLWINDELVVAEGGLKRGPNPRDTYFDSLNVREWLRPGHNQLLIHVHYLGVTGASHVSSGRAGLALQLCLEEGPLESDAQWQCRREVGWGPGFHRLGIELAEAEEHVDARRAGGDWVDVEVVPAGQGPWNSLVPRPLPLLRDRGLFKVSSRDLSVATSPLAEAVVFADPLLLQFRFSIQRVVAVESPFGRKSIAQAVFVFGTRNIDNYLEWTVDIRDEPELHCRHMVAGRPLALCAPVSLASVAHIETPQVVHQLEISASGGELRTSIDGLLVQVLTSPPSVTGAVGYSRNGWFNSTTHHGLTVRHAEGSLSWEGKASGEGHFLDSLGFQVIHRHRGQAVRYRVPLDHNAQFTPYLRVRAQAGLLIHISTNTNEHYEGSTWPFEVMSADYTTKEGEQEWEGFAWMNGEVLSFDRSAVTTMP